MTDQEIALARATARADAFYRQVLDAKDYLAKAQARYDEAANEQARLEVEAMLDEIHETLTKSDNVVMSETCHCRYCEGVVHPMDLNERGVCEQCEMKGP